MYLICFMDNEGYQDICVRADNQQPVVFDDDLDAWDFIKEVMKQNYHPRFMWLKEVS